MHDIVIIGGGPAGLTAGLYAGRARLKVLVVENPSIPSQAVITDLVENYPGFPDGITGPEIVEQIKKQILPLGVEIIQGEVKAVHPHTNNKLKTWMTTVEEIKIESMSLIIASGAQPKPLRISGEDKFRGRGVSYCAVCDGAFFKDKDIVVIGGGDAAVEEALFLTRFVKSIKLVHRRDKLRAAKIIQEKAYNNKKIELVLNSNAEEIIGVNSVEGVSVVNGVTNKKSVIQCAGVFIFVGYVPNTGFMYGLANMDKDGYIITDDNMWAYQDGVFACGDCRHKTLRQIVTACGDGAIAAFSAQQYVENLKGTAYEHKK